LDPDRKFLSKFLRKNTIFWKKIQALDLEPDPHIIQALDPDPDPKTCKDCIIAYSVGMVGLDPDPLSNRTMKKEGSSIDALFLMHDAWNFDMDAN